MRIALGMMISGLLFAQTALAQPTKRLVLLSGEVALDTDRELTYRSFRSVQVDDRGRFFYNAAVLGTNVFLTADDAYFMGTSRGQFFIMRELQGFPTIDDTLNFGNILQPKFSPYGSFAFKTALGGTGVIAQRNSDALVAGTVDRLDIIARQGSRPDFMLFPDDGGDGAVFNYDYLQTITTFEIFSSDYVLFDFSTVTNQINNNGFSSRALMLYSGGSYSLVYKSGMQAPGRSPAEFYTQTLRAYAMHSPGNIAWAARFLGGAPEGRIGVWRKNINANPSTKQVLDDGQLISAERYLQEVDNLWITPNGADMYVLAQAIDRSGVDDVEIWALGREHQAIDPVTSNLTSSVTWLGEDRRPVPGHPDLIFTNTPDGQFGWGSSFQGAGFDLFDNGDMLVYAPVATNGATSSKEMLFRVVDTNFVKLVAQGDLTPDGGTFDGFSSWQAMGTDHVLFGAATMRTSPTLTTYDLWYMRAEAGATPVKLLGQGDVFNVGTDDDREVEFILQVSGNRHGDVFAIVSFKDFTSALIYIHAPGLSTPPVILSETLVDGTFPIEIPFGIPGYRLMEATNLLGDWVASSVIPEGADESIRWEIPLDTPGRYFRFEPEE
jgi:hypothetical protein